MKYSTEFCDCNDIHDEAVKKAKSEMPTEKELCGLSELFKILGDPTRIRIMWALDKSEMCVCDLAAALDMTKSAISHQLNTLRGAKLVKFRRDGKNVFYSLDDQHVTDILELGMVHITHE